VSVRRIRLRLISCAVGAVVGMSTLNDDLLGLVFAHAGLDAKGLVAVGRVNRQWRRVVHANAQVLVLGATPPVVTKGVLMGLYALDGWEADLLPRVMRPRRGGGVMFLYANVAEVAWGVVGTSDEWEMRLARRAVKQASVERAFGPDWRRTRWMPHQRRIPQRIVQAC
jgi:hypothetical protein